MALSSDAIFEKEAMRQEFLMKYKDSPILPLCMLTELEDREDKILFPPLLIIQFNPNTLPRKKKKKKKDSCSGVAK